MAPKINQPLILCPYNKTKNKTTKNGYAISKIDAVDAPIILIAEKMKKLAAVATAFERKINPRFTLPGLNNVFKKPLPSANKSIGRIIIAIN